MWDGTERRATKTFNDQAILDRLGSIDVTIGIVETKIDGLHDTNLLVKEELKDHGIWDRWVQGTLLAVVLTILGKVFLK